MKNFYTGFEGECELVITLNGDHEEKFSAWLGYLDTVMTFIEAGQDGWEGFVMHYHSDTGFCEDTWRDPNPAHTAATVRAVLPQLSGDTLEFAEQFVKLAEQAAESGWLELKID